MPECTQWIYSVADRLERAFKKMVEFYLPNIPLLAGTQPPPPKKEEEPQHEEEVPLQSKHQFVDKLRLLSPANLKAVVECIQ